MSACVAKINAVCDAKNSEVVPFIKAHPLSLMPVIVCFVGFWVFLVITLTYPRPDAEHNPPEVWVFYSLCFFCLVMVGPASLLPAWLMLRERNSNQSKGYETMTERESEPVDANIQIDATTHY